MALLDFIKPKYRHKDPAVRLAAIGEIDPAETEILTELSVNDTDHRVRRGAIEHLADPATLANLSRLVAPAELPLVVARKEQLLHDLVLACPDQDLGLKSLREISSPELLASIAVNHSRTEMRREAVDRIADQQVLAAVLEQNCGKEPARLAMAKISDEELLTRLSKRAASKTARQLAGDKLAEINHQRTQPNPDEIARQTLSALATEAAALLTSIDIDQAAAKLELGKEQWRKLDPDGNHPDYSAFTGVCDDFARKFREIEERRALEREKALGYERLQAGLAEICTTIERLTGSPDPAAEEEKERMVSNWHSLLAETAGKATPSPAMAKRFAEVCRSFEITRPKIIREKDLLDAIEQNRQTAKGLIEKGALKKAGAALAEAEKKLDELKFKYFNPAATRKLVTATAADLARAERENHERNFDRAREICAELEKISAQVDTRSEGQLQELRRNWRELPNLDGGEAETLKERFRKGVADLTGKLQEFQQELDWQLWANLTLKEKLTAKVEALDGEEDLATVFKLVRESREEWKSIGPVPLKKSRKLWDSFHAACDRNFKRTEPYLAERNAIRAEALERRREICARAAELSESNDWRKTADTLKELQKEWQSLPAAPRKEERKLFKQFRKECDRFFERRKEVYLEQDKERREQLQKKEELCAEAEALAAEPQPEYAKKFRDLQAEWKKAGPVPREETDKIWTRFRTACDRYFSWLDEERRANLAQKEELCRQAEKVVAGTDQTAGRKEIADQLAEMQRRWEEIGPVPRGESEAIWQRFREPADSFFKAGQQQREEENLNRRLNQDRKEKLLARAEELAGRGADKKNNARMEKLQNEWSETGSAPRAADKELNQRFKALCDAFFGGRPQYFSDLKKKQFENQKKKESLCLRLENILGAARKPESGGRDRALSLAEELKQAMEDNFILAGRRNEKKTVGEEVGRIEQDWRNTGAVPYDQAESLNKRFQDALDRYYRSRR
ncbi:MAG: DUF349 domain-containing protein [Desulfurivibrionaceae bacterium]